MDIQYYGANCLKITTRKATLITDPHSDITSLSIDLKKVDTALATQAASTPSKADSVFLVDRPGEYEFVDYSVRGIPAQAHTAASGDKSITMYRITASEIAVLVTGHISTGLSEEQLESIGLVDVLIIPIGGNGYTLDAVGAAAVVRAVEPKLVIPVHSADDGLKYEVPQTATELFIKELGAPVAEERPEKLKLKALPEQLTVQLLKKT